MKRLMRKVYKTGTFTEVRDVWVGANARPRGKRVSGNTGLEQSERNLKAAARTLNALITGNFTYAAGDLWVCLTCDGEHTCTRIEMERRVKLFLRALARKLRQEGRELQWILSVSDMDGETGKTARPHCHMILSSADTDLIRTLWRYGTADVRTLHNRPHHKGLALYIVRQAPKDPNTKKWTSSRNLKRAKLVREYWVKPGERYRLPAHAVEADREYDPDAGKQLYLAYALDKPKMLRDVKAGSGAGVGGNNQAGRGRGNKENARGREGGLNTGGGDTVQVRKGKGRAEKADNHGKGGPGGGTAGSDHGKGEGKNKNADADNGRGSGRNRNADADNGRGSGRNRNADADNGRGSGNNRKADADNNTSGGRGGHAV